MKPLFIPLKKEYFDAFELGEKTVEFRALNERWNLKNCSTGRAVVLSCGYGRSRRLKGFVSSSQVRPGYTLDNSDREAVRQCYGSEDINVICINIGGLSKVTDYCGVCGAALSFGELIVYDPECGACCVEHFTTHGGKHDS